VEPDGPIRHDGEDTMVALRIRGIAFAIAIGIGLLNNSWTSAEDLLEDGLSTAGSFDDAEETLPRTIDDLPNPPAIRSRDGVLEATLVAAPRRVTVAGRTFTTNVFNGRYSPPTLIVKRGDEFRLTVVNHIGPADVEIDGPELTNVHYHGTDVTPIPPGDSVFVRIRPGQSFENRFTFPQDHPQGLHWYHTHLHGFVEPQILSGLSGMLIVDGVIADHYPELLDLRQRVMLLKANLLPDQDPNSALTKTINGYRDPPIRARPSEYQIWMLGNLGADAFFNLALEGHEFWVLERDGNMLRKAEKQKTLFLPAGARLTVVVRAGKPGRYVLRSLATDTGPQGDPNPTVRLGTFIVSGSPSHDDNIAGRLERPAADIPGITPPPSEIVTLPRQVTNKRTFVFSETADGNTFFINGKEYKESRVNTRVPLGAIEEWTLLNTSGELHVFHIHQLSFLVTEVNGRRLDPPEFRDVVNLPYAKNNIPGKVKVVIPFNNPIMVGKFVYHCHIVGHEDAGMMANIRVYRPGVTETDSTGLADATPPAGILGWLRRLAGSGLAWASLSSAAEAGINEDALVPEGELCLSPNRTERALRIRDRRLTARL
jgi:FtsP/CotA-like multicopper oxidase with cupredoxin domain